MFQHNPLAQRPLRLPIHDLGAPILKHPFLFIDNSLATSYPLRLLEIPITQINPLLLIQILLIQSMFQLPFSLKFGHRILLSVYQVILKLCKLIV